MKLEANSHFLPLNARADPLKLNPGNVTATPRFQTLGGLLGRLLGWLLGRLSGGVLGRMSGLLLGRLLDRLLGQLLGWLLV